MSDRSPRDSRSGQARAMLPAWPSTLVVIAHPDDESFGLGAVIDKITSASADRIDLCVRVSRERQRRAALLHASQISAGAVLWRRLRLLGDREYLRWLVPPAAAITSESAR